MAHLQYFSYEGFGENQRKETHYSQAVQIGDNIELSGQGGWDRLTSAIPPTFSAQVEAAFANIEHALQHAGGKGRSQVYKLRAYCAPLNAENAGEIVRNLRKYCPEHEPLYTVVGVQNLALTETKVEIEVVAHLGE